MSRSKLILLRHGKSLWNERNRFTGWVDIPLSEKGIEEAKNAGERIKDIPIDTIYTSSLARAQMTAFICMLKHSSGKVPVLHHKSGEKEENWSKIYDQGALGETIPMYASWHLNERMYGKLQGLNKDQTRQKFGKDQVQIWRRSFDTPPPEGESLEMTANRTIPFFEENIIPILNEGKNVLISAHGNSLRSIVMKLDDLSKDEVVKLEIKTGDPIIYNFKDNSWNRDLSR